MSAPPLEVRGLVKRYGDLTAVAGKLASALA